jgi:hypothetical protein
MPLPGSTFILIGEIEDIDNIDYLSTFHSSILKGAVLISRVSMCSIPRLLVIDREGRHLVGAAARASTTPC